MPSKTNEQSSRGSSWIDPDALRTDFTLAMSAMYKAEVPLYGDLVQIVNEVNTSTFDSRSPAARFNSEDGQIQGRIDIERHGAIRLGTAHELRTIRRIFAIIGLQPVGYYDLSAAGLPMHATCFRPLTEESLRRNPFRVFTSVLRPELLKDRKARTLALGLLSKRNIFSDDLMNLLDTADRQDGYLKHDEGQIFVSEVMKTFGWQGTATATYNEYQCLQSEHPILADIACFQTAHINHLTPRTLNISVAQKSMREKGLKVKPRIEGPPSRLCPILLRQTSFLAIEEPVKFLVTESSSPLSSGSHRARFGEIEERGAAVTPKGRQLYDKLLGGAMTEAEAFSGSITAESLDGLIDRSFNQYPDDWDELRRQDLIYCMYRPLKEKGPSGSDSESLDRLIDDGLIESIPITYEDFLPLSAAGIFQSNLGSRSSGASVEAVPDKEGIEEALGKSVCDSDEVYSIMQSRSIEACEKALGISIRV